MYSSSHEEDAFRQLAQQGLQEASQRMPNDPAVQAAARALEQAQRQRELDPLSDEPILALDAAQKAYNKATNDFSRREHLAGLAAQKAERDRLAEEQDRAYAQQHEAAAKEDFRMAWLRANGDADGFEQAWKAHWDAEKRTRAEAAQHELKQTLHRQGGYPGF
jgi:hypothetical protein